MNKARIAAYAIVAFGGISTLAIDAIRSHEGERLVAYTPVAGDVATVGVGATTYEDGSRVKLGDKITPERSKQLLKHHVKTFERSVARCADVPLFQHEFDAYVSLTYNIGSQAFCTSTLVQKLKAQDYAGACSQILRWNRFKGRELRGLTNRRQAEYRQCMGESP
ncbi:MAG: lysozyme [Shewanella sp.]